MNRVDLWRPYYGMAVVILMGPGNQTVLVREPERPDSKWKFPGGKLEEGESPVTAALRELKEETGVVLSSMDLEHLDTRYKQPRDYHIHFFAALLDDFEQLSPRGETGEIMTTYPLNRILGELDQGILGGFGILPDHIHFLKTYEPSAKTHGRRHVGEVAELQHV